MKLFFPIDVDQITTSVHTHAKAKAKRGEAPVPLVVICADETCIAEMKRYGAADNLRAVPKTYDQGVQAEEDREESERLSAVMARELAKQGRDAVVAGR